MKEPRNEEAYAAATTVYGNRVASLEKSKTTEMREKVLVPPSLRRFKVPANSLEKVPGE